MLYITGTAIRGGQLVHKLHRLASQIQPGETRVLGTESANPLEKVRGGAGEEGGGEGGEEGGKKKLAPEAQRWA